MVNKQLPKAWVDTIRSMVFHVTDGRRDWLEFTDFNRQVWITTTWGSTYHFRNALFLRDKKDSKTLVILTEHDGYFLFELEDVEFFSQRKTGESPLSGHFNKDISGTGFKLPTTEE